MGRLARLHNKQEFPISTLRLGKIIRLPPNLLKPKSPWPLLSGTGARFGRSAHLSGMFPATNLPP
jgi:hypothetical protein